jgi:hypothetical protein
VVLEFSAKVNGKELKGIDLIRFDETARSWTLKSWCAP